MKRIPAIVVMASLAAYGQKIGRTVESDAVFKREAFAGPHLSGDVLEASVAHDQFAQGWFEVLLIAAPQTFHRAAAAPQKKRNEILI